MNGNLITGFDNNGILFMKNMLDESLDFLVRYQLTLYIIQGISSLKQLVYSNNSNIHYGNLVFNDSVV